MQQTLGKFGDARLEKGGRCFWTGLLRQAVMGSGFGDLVVIEQVRSGLHGFCAIRQ
jgi:hypothetical protein